MSGFETADTDVYWIDGKLAISVEGRSECQISYLSQDDAKRLLQWLQANQPADKEDK